MRKTIVLIDRDGTLIYDNKYHLGRTKDWKKKVKILPTVVSGLKLLKKNPNIHVYTITNQPGVAIKDFPLLTMTKAHEVAKFVMKELNNKGGNIEDFFVCSHADPSYVKKRGKYKFDKKEVCKCSCIKPRLGMVFDALKKEGITRRNANVYVIGDRESDVKTALNIKGTGILVPFVNEPGQAEKVKKIKGKKYVAKSFLDAANYILKKEKAI